MAYQKGTATNFADLLNKFVTFLTTDSSLVAAGQAATLVFRSAPATWEGKIGTSVQREHVVFRQKGLAGQDEIYSGITTHGDTALDYYNWKIYGATGFSAGGLGNNYPDLGLGMVNPCPPVGALLWNASMTYWFFATGRKWWIVAKVSNIYISFGAGLILPSVTPSEYPYPMAVWSGYPDSTDRWSTSNDWLTGISTPKRRSMYLYQPNGRWADFYGASGYAYESQGGTYRLMWPTYPQYTAYIDPLRDSPGGKFPLLPITLYSFNTEGKATYGEADGLFFCPVLNNGAEDEVLIDGIRYIVFPSAARSGSPYLFALRVDA